MNGLNQTSLDHFIGQSLILNEFIQISENALLIRLTYEQGTNNSFYFAEELHSTEQVPKSIIVSDRATLFNLLIGLDGYTISSGVLSADLNGTDICAVPLESEEHMDIGYIHPAGTELSPLGRRYIELLQAYIQRYGLKLIAS